MTTQIIGINKKASFYADDRILLGEGLFETIRIEQQQPCYSQLHWLRMRQAAKLLGISFDISCNVWYEQLMYCIQQAEIKDGGVKVILSGGRAPRGLDAQGEHSSLAFEVFSYSLHGHALHLLSAPWRRDAKNPIYQFKSINYLESILARRYAMASGADDVLFFNLDHHATETTVANLFIIKQNQIFTPRLTDGLLAGITRGRLITLCKCAGIDCIETSIDSAMLGKADAVFVTNILQGIRAIESFDGNFLPIDHPLVNIVQLLLATDEERWQKTQDKRG